MEVNMYGSTHACRFNGSIAYSNHIIKNYIQAEKIDHKIKPALELKTNKEQVWNNFLNIIFQHHL